MRLSRHDLRARRRLRPGAGQANLPASAQVVTYPVEERHGVAWVWMGAPEQADPACIFDMDELSDPGWHLHLGDHLHLQASYLNVAENLVDPAHVSFVHPTTLGSAASENVPVHVSTGARSSPPGAGSVMRRPSGSSASSATSRATWTAGTTTTFTCPPRR